MQSEVISQLSISLNDSRRRMRFVLTALHAIIRIGLNIPAVRMQLWIQHEELFDSDSVLNS